MSTAPPSPASPDLGPPATAPPAAVSLPDRWPWWSGVVAWLAGAAGGIFAGVLFVVLGAAVGTDPRDPPPSLAISGALVGSLVLGVTAVVFASMWGRPRAADLGLRRTRVLPAVGWALLVFVAFFCLTALYSALVKTTEKDDLPSALGADKSAVALVGVAVLACVVAPLTEEILFRGYIFRALRNARLLRTAGAALVTGLLFGALHVGGTALVFLPVLTILGAGLCLLYAATRSLLPGIVLHSINNTIALSTVQKWSFGEGVLAGAGALSVIALVVALVMALDRRSDRRRSQPQNGLNTP